MDTLLPLLFFMIMGLAVLAYSILDGFDLGIGMLLPLGNEAEKDRMIACIGPFWDANETWIVLGVGTLLIAFPEAHGRILTALYLPVTLMLIGLIMRGVAFDLRVKAGPDKKQRWNRVFFIGSLIASVTQGWMVGAYITGLKTDLQNTLFAALIAVLLPAFYVFLGSAWLMIKTEDDLFGKAVAWGRRSLLPMAGALLVNLCRHAAGQYYHCRALVYPPQCDWPGADSTDLCTGICWADWLFYSVDRDPVSLRLGTFYRCPGYWRNGGDRAFLQSLSLRGDRRAHHLGGCISNQLSSVCACRCRDNYPGNYWLFDLRLSYFCR